MSVSIEINEEENVRFPDAKEPPLIISDLKGDGKIVWLPTAPEDIEKSEVKPSDYVEEKLGVKSIKSLASTFFEESQKHGKIYFLLLVPFLQFCLG